MSIDTDVRMPDKPTAATAMAAVASPTIDRQRRIVNVANLAEGPSVAGSWRSRRRIGHREKNPGTTRNSTASVAITPTAA